MTCRMLFFSIAVAAGACAGPITPEDAVAVREGVTVSYNRHTGISTTLGPLVHNHGDDGFFNDGRRYSYFLRLFKKKDVSLGTQLYVHAYFREWAFLDSAYSEGNKLDVTQISRKVGSCSNYGCTVEENGKLALMRYTWSVIGAKPRRLPGQQPV